MTTNAHFLSLNGKRVVSGRVTLPRYGTWLADVELADAELVKGAATFALGDLTLKGSVRPARTAAFGGKVSVRIVGGAGGWNKVIKPKSYNHAAGVKLSTVLGDAASAAGEKIAIASDSVVGTGWTRKQGRASRVLKLLIDDKWWVDAEGVTQTKARPSDTIATPFQIIEYKPHLGQLEIATENFKDWMPGRKFKAPTLSAEQTISSVSFTISEGRIRLLVTNSETAEERLFQQIRAIIRDEVCRLEYGSIVEYEITSAKEMEIACKPTAGKDSPWPELSGVKLKAGLFGETVKPTVGAKCLIMFMDDDPSLARCIGVEGASQTTKFSSSGNIEATAGGIFKVNGGAHWAALADVAMSNYNAIGNWATSHGHGTGVGPSTPPLTPFPTMQDVSSSKLKTD